MYTNINDKTVCDMLDFHIPRFDELPNIPLYKDQVIIYVENTLKVIHNHSSEKLLTPTMLNNYVKQKVISPPQNKKYTQKHLAYLIVVCLLKHVYTLNEICELISVQISTCPIDHAYDYFCVELENSLKSVFTTRDFSVPNSAITYTKESEIVRSAVLSFSHKIFIQKFLYEKEKSTSQNS